VQVTLYGPLSTPAKQPSGDPHQPHSCRVTHASQFTMKWQSSSVEVRRQRRDADSREVTKEARTIAGLALDDVALLFQPAVAIDAELTPARRLRAPHARIVRNTGVAACVCAAVCWHRAGGTALPALVVRNAGRGVGRPAAVILLYARLAVCAKVAAIDCNTGISHCRSIFLNGGNKIAHRCRSSTATDCIRCRGRRVLACCRSGRPYRTSRSCEQACNLCRTATPSTNPPLHLSVWHLHRKGHILSMHSCTHTISLLPLCMYQTSHTSLPSHY
jgi:hypothetical protein